MWGGGKGRRINQPTGKFKSTRDSIRFNFAFCFWNNLITPSKLIWAAYIIYSKHFPSMYLLLLLSFFFLIVQNYLLLLCVIRCFTTSHFTFIKFLLKCLRNEFWFWEEYPCRTGRVTCKLFRTASMLLRKKWVSHCRIFRLMFH